MKNIFKRKQNQPIATAIAQQVASDVSANCEPFAIRVQMQSHFNPIAIGGRCDARGHAGSV
jgi:hypothetical protein